jgi:acyl-CoA hydrolase
MSFAIHSTTHLVKSEDLNHHGTLYAGRSMEWFVEAGFIAVAYDLPPENIVCLQIHGIEFLYPVYGGSIISYSSRIIRTGNSTVTVYVEVKDCRCDARTILDGFITFCHVDETTKAVPHGLVYVPETEREIELNKKAIELTKKK